MSTHKDEKNGTWYVMVRYHDWKGEKKQKCKRGFATKRDAQEWETALLKKIEATIQETVTSCLKEFQITTVQPKAEKSEPPAQPDPPDEMEERIVAFLDNF